MNEFDLIRKYFIPLSKPFPGSLNLSDDAAILSLPPGYDLIVTKDAISENTHYLPGTDPALIARKLLRTNLSDLAAMGATPLCYFLALALPKPLSENFIARFAEGLAADQKEFNIHLAGGDTIATSGTAVMSLTAHGLVPHAQALRRNGAQPGDAVYVSGTLGDAALGLLKAKAGETHHLTERYHLPQPRLALGETLRGLATSCIDISDGLLADAGHVAAASGVAMELNRELLPLSPHAAMMLEESPELWPLIYSGGDDYELLFTLSNHHIPPANTTRIGTVANGSGVRLLLGGVEQPIQKSGYSH